MYPAEVFIGVVGDMMLFLFQLCPLIKDIDNGCQVWLAVRPGGVSQRIERL